MDAPQKKSMPWWGWLLIIFGVFALIGIAGVGVLVWWINANKDRIAGDAQKSMHDAREFATSHDQTACVDEGLRRGAQCDGIMCEANAQIFLKLCIQQAPKTAGFCESVPKPSEYMKTGTWIVDECRRRGQSNNQRCTRLLQGIPQGCHQP
jgi:hypothetical protein